MARSVEDPPVAKAVDRTPSHDETARAIAELSPDEAAFVLHQVETMLRKRKMIQIGGYAAAMFAWLIGMTLALIYFGMNDESALWAFIVPFGAVGVILYGFGTWAKRVGKRPPPAPPAT